MKQKKRKKSSRGRGQTSFRGARKKARGKGNRGGKGMSGSGKRADQKKSWIFRYKHPYFGSKAKKMRRSRKENKINVGDISKNLRNFIDRGKAEKEAGKIRVNLEDHKILGSGEINEKIIIKAKDFSKTAKKKIEDAGGKIEKSGKQEKEKSKK